MQGLLCFRAALTGPSPAQPTPPQSRALKAPASIAETGALLGLGRRVGFFFFLFSLRNRLLPGFATRHPDQGGVGWVGGAARASVVEACGVASGRTATRACQSAPVQFYVRKRDEGRALAG